MNYALCMCVQGRTIKANHIFSTSINLPKNNVCECCTVILEVHLLSPKVFCHGSNETNRVLKNSRRVLSESQWHKWNILRIPNNRFAAVALNLGSLLEFSDSEVPKLLLHLELRFHCYHYSKGRLDHWSQSEKELFSYQKSMAITFWSQVKSRIQVKTWVWLHLVLPEMYVQCYDTSANRKIF